MSLPRFSIKHPVTTLMIMFMAILLGVVSLTSTQMDLMPKFSPPVAAVMTTFPGASPEEIAKMVTEPIEAAVATTSGMKKVSSISRESMSVVVLQFSWGTDMREARDELNDRLSRVRLPEDAAQPTIVKFDPTMLPVMDLSVANGKDLADLKGLAENELKTRLEAIDGVAAVEVAGGLDREIRVDLDQSKLAKYGITQSQVAQAIQASNLTYPAGSIKTDDRHLSLRIVSEMNQADVLRDLVVAMVPQVPKAPAVPQVPAAGASNQGNLGQGNSGPAAPGQGAHTLPAGITPSLGGLQGLMPGLATSGMPATPAAPKITYKAIKLSDVATVSDGFTDQQSITRTGGADSLGLSVQKEGDANIVNVARSVRAEIEQIKQEYPDLTLVITSDQAAFIEEAVGNVSQSLILGGFLAVLILLVFLRNFRSTLIIAVSIPFSVVVTFVLIYFSDITLNIMSLGGLALGVGMLVDNSIVVIENTYRHLQMGKPPAEAARVGAEEVAGAITSSTLTTVAVFLPVAFVTGLTGDLFRELALTVSFSLLASLAVALTVIPMMASRLMRARAAAVKAPGRLLGDSTYAGILRWALRRRAITLLAAMAVLAGSLSLVPRIGTEFLPVTDEGRYTISVRMPTGTDLATTTAKVAEIESILKAQPDVEVVFSRVGGGSGFRALRSGANAGQNTAVISVTMKPLEDRSRSTPEAMAAVRDQAEKIKGPADIAYNLQSTQASMGGGQGNSLEVSVTGLTLEGLRGAVDQVALGLGRVDGLRDLESNLDVSKPEVQVVVDREKAAKKGLSPMQVALTVSNAVRGQVATRFENEGQTTNVRVIYRRADREDVSKLGEMLLKSPLGDTVKLKDVAQIVEASGPVTITRENQRVSAQVSGLIEGRDLGTVSQDAAAAIKELKLPAGYRAELSGASSLMSEGFSGMGQALLLAILLVYMIMAAQFESLLHPFTIMFSLPLAAVGVLLGLFVSGYALGITAFMGLVILAGIVVNNAIVLVDLVNQLRNGGMSTFDALVEAGRLRLRPILMTALTTILGLVPMALGIGEGTETQAPMAVVVIGGLLTSTLLTLVVVPVMYSLFAGTRKPVPVLAEVPEADVTPKAERVPGAEVLGAGAENR